jgi:hypothetical protein
LYTQKSFVILNLQRLNTSVGELINVNDKDLRIELDFEVQLHSDVSLQSLWLPSSSSTPRTCIYDLLCEVKPRVTGADEPPPSSVVKPDMKIKPPCPSNSIVSTPEHPIHHPPLVNAKSSAKRMKLSHGFLIQWEKSSEMMAAERFFEREESLKR